MDALYLMKVDAVTLLFRPAARPHIACRNLIDTRGNRAIDLE